MAYALFCLAIFAKALQALTVPSSPPSNASQQLDPASVGVSIEFFAFPDYMNTVPATATCLSNLGSLSGHMPHMRIGGTTQDRATYNASLGSPVSYIVASPSDAPASLTFGPSYMELAGKYAGNITIGFNRRLNDQPNTINASRKAVKSIKNLYSIELGNEPDLYKSTDPIAGGSWSPSEDVASQEDWQAAVSHGLNKSAIVEAGVYLQPPNWAIAKLAPSEGPSGRYVKSFSGHSYPQSACGGASTNLQSLMSHSGIVTYTAKYSIEAKAAKAIGKPYVLGETNSATCGGGGISPTFGAALWIVDYTMQAVINGASRLYFHQGTIGNCQYCWWGRYSMGAPYYGAYFAAAALANADSVAMLDNGTTPYAAYAVYKGGKPIRVILYNSNYYTSGTRSSHTFELTGLPGLIVKGKRLTAPAATSRQDRGGNPRYGGQSFANGTCKIQGAESLEMTKVSGKNAAFVVKASEALLLYL